MELRNARSGREAKRTRAHRPAQSRPVEAGAGIGLASGGDVLVPGDVGDGIARSDLVDERCEHRVLALVERLALEALELDADREVVAAVAAAPCRASGV